MRPPASLDLTFFLGGQDLEMITIRALIKEAGAQFHDKGLRWGARASAYATEIAAALTAGRTPVLVELVDDLGLADAVRIVDHHGSRAGVDRPSSLEQVFSLLHLPAARKDRWFELVSANDKGYVYAMQRIGASAEEMRRVCAAEWRAQGITADEAAVAEAAAAEIVTLHGGKITVARLPHNRCRPLCDALEPALGGPGYRRLLVLSPDEVNAYGPGAWLAQLEDAFTGGWSGGDLPQRGFWGHAGVDPAAVLAWARRTPPAG